MLYKTPEKHKCQKPPPTSNNDSSHHQSKNHHQHPVFRLSNKTPSSQFYFYSILLCPFNFLVIPLKLPQRLFTVVPGNRRFTFSERKRLERN